MYLFRALLVSLALPAAHLAASSTNDDGAAPPDLHARGLGIGSENAVGMSSLPGLPSPFRRFSPARPQRGSVAGNQLQLKPYGARAGESKAARKAEPEGVPPDERQPRSAEFAAKACIGRGRCIKESWLCRVGYNTALDKGYPIEKPLREPCVCVARRYCWVNARGLMPNTYAQCYCDTTRATL